MTNSQVVTQDLALLKGTKMSCQLGWYLVVPICHPLWNTPRNSQFFRVDTPDLYGKILQVDQICFQHRSWDFHEPCSYHDEGMIYLYAFPGFGWSWMVRRLSRVVRSYPLVNVYIIMENHHRYWENSRKFYGHFPVRKLWVMTRW